MTCRSSGTSGGESWQARGSTSTKTSSTATRSIQVATHLAGRCTPTLEPQSRVDLGPFGRRGDPLQDFLQFQHVVLGKRAAASVGHEIHHASVGVTDDDTRYPDAVLHRSGYLSGPLYAVQTSPFSSSCLCGCCGLWSRGTSPSDAARRIRTPLAA